MTIITASDNNNSKESWGGGCPSFGTKIRAAIKEVCVWWLGTAKKLRVAFFFFFPLWGHLGGKGDMEARDMRAQRKCGWLVEGCWGGAPKLDCRWPKLLS